MAIERNPVCQKDTIQQCRLQVRLGEWNTIKSQRFGIVVGFNSVQVQQQKQQEVYWKKCSRMPRTLKVKEKSVKWTYPVFLRGFYLLNRLKLPLLHTQPTIPIPINRSATITKYALRPIFREVQLERRIRLLESRCAIRLKGFLVHPSRMCNFLNITRCRRQRLLTTGNIALFARNRVDPDPSTTPN